MSDETEATNTTPEEPGETTEVQPDLESPAPNDVRAEDHAEVATETRARVPAEAEAPVAVVPREFLRFSLVFRLQHVGMFLSVITLIITGLPLKFAASRWAEVFFHMTGGVHAAGIIHRAAASVLIVVGVFHLFYTALTAEGRHNLMELRPKIKDVVDVVQNVLYFFGFTRNPPRFARFSYIEKFDYWAVYWGMVVMIGSGLMLWFSTETMTFLPKFMLDVAHEMHSDEALLATLAIVVWHFYNAHFNPDHFPMNFTWWHGKVTEEQMKHHHPLEYERLMAETPDQPHPAEEES